MEEVSSSANAGYTKILGSVLTVGFSNSQVR